VTDTSSTMYLWLAFVIGGLGYCFTWMFVRMTSRRTLPKQHAEVREQVIYTCMRWIEAEQERLYCEHELVRLRESAPDEQSLWIVHSMEQLRSLPPVFVHLSRRFGFKVPDHDHARSPEPSMAFAVEQEEQTEEESAWGSYEDSGSSL